MKILIVSNNDHGLYKFRMEIIEELLKEHTVYILLPAGDFIDKFEQSGCIHIDCEFDRRGQNPIKEIKLYKYYKKILKEIKPDIVLTYTIKPNIYCGMICARLKIPCIVNITGLGTSIENSGLLQKFILKLYRYALRDSQKVFFQNKSNMEYMLKNKVVIGKYDLLPGSGVNLMQHIYEEYPIESNELVFTTIGRIMKDKGTDEILSAAEIIKSKYSNVVFRFIGDYDEMDYRVKIENADKRGIIEYLGKQKDVHPYIKSSHAIIHASYHEGMSNVLLESASTGRPVIATDVPGCIEAYDDGITGISCKSKNVVSLVEAIEKFIALPYEKKAAMGRAGRLKMEKEFNRSIVIKKYIDEIQKIIKEH